jgi:hypothetical protein
MLQAVDQKNLESFEMWCCLLQQVIEGEIKGGIEVTGRRGRRRRKLLDDLNPLAPELFFLNFCTHCI